MSGSGGGQVFVWEAAPRSVADAAPWVLQGHDDGVEVNAVVCIGVGLISDLNATTLA